MSSLSHRSALLIGIEHYADDHFARLPSIRADLEQLGEVLNHRAIGGFDVQLKSDLRASEMREAISEFCLTRDPDELTLLYISSHGERTPTGEFFFVASDTYHGDLDGTAISATYVNECLENCFSQQRVAVLDCCASGGFALGFRTKGSMPVGGENAGRASHLSPLAPTGVYVLSSSDVDQASFAGGGSLEEPEPSLFTGALVDVLRSGRAGTSASGLVSIDDLFDAVTDQLRRAPQRQTPVKSAIRVSGRIPIAARPLGGTPQLATQKQRDASKPRTGPGRVPGWPELLAYYHDAVRAEMGWLPLLPVRGDDYVCLPGRERVLCGATDEDGCVPLPSDAEQLISATASNDGVEWWVGWPAVVLFGEPGKRRSTVPHFAPLLMRQVEVATAGVSLRLRPLGPVVPHPGLAHARLDEEEAAALAATYQPTWHHGESGRMAEDAGHLLRDDFTLPAVEELRPDLLSDRIDTATPLEGARNTAVLFGVTPAAPNKGLLSELAKIADQPTAIAGTALAWLFPQSTEKPAAAAVAIVTPKAANPSQRAVLASAMTRPLTVATGPPGTGKSQLVVDAVATAVAAKQSVLVASTNNQAVNEVWERCQQIVPGLLIRTGNRDARALEAAGLQELLGAPHERRRETQEAAFRSANRQLVAVQSDLDEIASRERELLALGRARQAAEQRIGRSPRELNSTFGLGWGQRARRLASAPWWAFGGLRRRRFLERLEMVAPAEQAQESCEALADLADVDERWQAARGAAQSTPSDEHLIRALDSAQRRVEESSRELVKGAVQDRAVEGQRQIADLLRAQATRLDWGEFRRALPFIRGWAATSLSAKRFPFGPKLFDLVIIDEASQCSIPSIVPLLFRARRVLVIGDAMQLPPVVTLPVEIDAMLRARHDISGHWLGENRLSPVRHSAFAAAEHAAGGSLLLDEHYRCHPEIAAIPNRLFYQGQLRVLTDIRNRPHLNKAPILWSHVRGHAERGTDGTSWQNPIEAQKVVRCVREVLDELPETATIGVVTPYKPQADALQRTLRDFDARVRVGTAHKFQGGERDIMVLSLVAADNVEPRAFDWADQQRELWNVAITRARSHLIVVGDENVWTRRGGVGGDLLAAAREPAAVGDPLDQDLLDRLYESLRAAVGASVELGVASNGYRTDAVVSTSGKTRRLLVDPGASGPNTGTHLSQVLRRWALLGHDAVRIPAWWLYDVDEGVADRVVLHTANTADTETPSGR